LPCFAMRPSARWTMYRDFDLATIVIPNASWWEESVAAVAVVHEACICTTRWHSSLKSDLHRHHRQLGGTCKLVNESVTREMETGNTTHTGHTPAASKQPAALQQAAIPSPTPPGAIEKSPPLHPPPPLFPPCTKRLVSH
jgi:hypothetical protein